jgi:Holliday junction DNA helicase RuvA
MISALTGELRRVDEDRVHLQVGPVALELLVPAVDLEDLRDRAGETLTFHTLLYLQGDASGGNIEPRLIGFLRIQDKRFFEKFITVKGIGPKTALRALTVPVGEIAEAIESKDARFLVQLDGIGKRTAELIVAELSGKVAAFAGETVGARSPGAPTGSQRRSAIEADAIDTLVQLGERRADAEHLLDRLKQSSDKLTTTDALVREMLRLRMVRV